MHDHGMILRPTFCTIDAVDRVDVLGISAQAIDSFSRKGHEAALGQHLDRTINLRIGRKNLTTHDLAIQLNLLRSHHACARTLRRRSDRQSQETDYLICCSDRLGKTATRAIDVTHLAGASRLPLPI